MATRATTRPITPRISSVSPPLTRVMTCCTPRGNPITMPAKIKSEMPLPTPRSVICSPSHITKIVPVVKVRIVVRRNPQVGAPTPLICSQCATKVVCKQASPTVR